MIHLGTADYLVVLVMIFLAGLIDSIAGGGGLISLPTYLFVGLPPHLALGTNKFSSCWGTLFSTGNYLLNKMIDLPVALTTAAAALLGSWLGTRTVLLINPNFLNYILIFLIPVIALITILNQNLGKLNRSEGISVRRKYGLCLVAGLVVGFYDGFFGPGTGTFLILFFTFLLKYDYIIANGNTKIVNLASNLAAVITFAASGSILYKLAIPAACCGILGNLAGSKLVILRGNNLIRRIFLLALVLLMARIVWNVIFG
jgi:uncharacterized protein